MGVISEKQVRRIVALAHACGLPWARCRSSFADGDEVQHCALPLFHRHTPHESALSMWPYYFEPIPVTIEEWRARWADAAVAFGVQHGVGPVTSWWSADGRCSWAVDYSGRFRIVVGSAWASLSAIGVLEFGDNGDGLAKSSDLTELARLVAVAVATGTTP